MRMKKAFYKMSMYVVMYMLYKNILEYAQIARNGTESKIPYIESHSNHVSYIKLSIDNT